jgi:hypothetical protein
MFILDMENNIVLASEIPLSLTRLIDRAVCPYTYLSLESGLFVLSDRVLQEVLFNPTDFLLFYVQCYSLVPMVWSIGCGF